MKGQNGTDALRKVVTHTETNNILTLFNARDERAVAEIINAYSGMCMRLAMNILGNREDAEEVINDVLMQLWQSIPPAAPTNMEAYVVTVTRRTALKYCEKRNAEKRGGGRTAAVLDELDRVLCAEDDVEEDYNRLELRESIGRFLRTLQPEQKTMFVQRYWYFCTSREIARELHISETKVRVTLMRLRGKLKEQLQREELL